MSSFSPKISWMTIIAGRLPPGAGRANAARIGRPLAAGKLRSRAAATGHLLLPERDGVVPERVDGGALSRVDDDRRERLLDDRGPEDRLPGREPGAVVDRGRDETAVEVGPTGAEAGAAEGATRGAGQGRLRVHRDGLQAKAAEDRLLVATGVGVQLLVELVEPLDGVRQHACRHLAVLRRQGHRHVEGLPGVA